MNAPDPVPLRLTSFSHGGGCGCKIAPGVLQEILGRAAPGLLPKALLVGVETSDDAAVYQLNERQAIVATTDFFMPIVDDPFDFGAIAATNAISDVYAMGATPLFALALVGMPVDKLPIDTIRLILAGGESICAKAGIPIAGGHTIDSVEPIYGLVAIGVVDPANVKRNAGARPGDVLILGKPLGVGIYSAALKKGLLAPDGYAAMLAQHDATEHAGHRAGHDARRACADRRHGLRLARPPAARSAAAAESRRTIDFARLPLHPDVMRLAHDGIVTGASARNWAGVHEHVDLAPSLGAAERALLTDPQTSGRIARRLRARTASTMCWRFSVPKDSHDAAVIGIDRGGDAAHRGWIEHGHDNRLRHRDVVSHLGRCATRLAPIIAMMFSALSTATTVPQPATAAGAFGLYPAQDFRLATGECRDCPTIRQALWYFRDQTIAVPLAGHPVSGFTTGVHAEDDVRAWAAARPPAAPIDYPPLVWVAAPDIVRGARLSAGRDATRDARRRAAVPSRREDPAQSLVLRRVVGRVLPAARRSRCAARRPTTDSSRARSGRKTSASAAQRPRRERCRPACLRAEALRSLMREEPRGGAQSPYAASTLWQTDRHARATGRVARCSRSWSTARRATTTRRMAGTSRSSPDASQADGADRRLAGQQFLFARRRERKGHPRRAGSARQLSCRPQLRPGLVPALVHGRRRAEGRARGRAGAIGAQPRVQPVLAAPAGLLPPER